MKVSLAQFCASFYEVNSNGVISLVASVIYVYLRFGILPTWKGQKLQYQH